MLRLECSPWRTTADSLGLDKAAHEPATAAPVVAPVVGRETRRDTNTCEAISTTHGLTPLCTPSTDQYAADSRGPQFGAPAMRLSVLR